MAAIPATVTTTVLSLGYKSQEEEPSQGGGQKHWRENQTGREREQGE
jgi:hypothetical protein